MNEQQLEFQIGRQKKEIEQLTKTIEHLQTRIERYFLDHQTAKDIGWIKIYSSRGGLTHYVNVNQITSFNRYENVTEVRFGKGGIIVDTPVHELMLQIIGTECQNKPLLSL